MEVLLLDSLCLMADLVTKVLAEDPYIVLKGGLLSARQLTDFQRAVSFSTCLLSGPGSSHSSWRPCWRSAHATEDLVAAFQQPLLVGLILYQFKVLLKRLDG